MARRSKLVLGAVAGCIWALGLVLLARAAVVDALPVTDALTIRDQVSASPIPAIRPAPSDSATLTDQVTDFLEAAIRPVLSDTATIGDHVNAALQAAFRPALADSATIGDHVSAALQAAFRPALTDSATIGDQVSASLRAAFRPALADTATIGDQVNAALQAAFRPALADTATIGDRVSTSLRAAFRPALADTTTIGDHVSASVRAAFRPALADTATIGDQLNARLAAVLRPALADTASIADHVNARLGGVFRPALRDSARIGDQVSVVFVVQTTTTTISSSRNPSVFGDTVTLTAAVSASGSTPGSADGTVTFTDGAATMCAAVPLDPSGHATCTDHLLTAGTHIVDATYNGSSRFTASNASLNQQVLPALLVVTAQDTTKVYGSPNPGFTVSYAGFVNGDTPASLGGTLAFGTSATQGSFPGIYQVTPSGLTSANYSISFVSGTLTILPAAPLITAPSDGVTSSSGSLTVSGTGLAGATITVRDGSSTVATAAVDASGSWSVPLSLAIGAHQLSATQTDNGQTSASSGIVHVTVLDADLALAGMPGPITVNATGPAGTVVAYTAPTAVDEQADNPAPAVNCSPASGTTFVIGTTTVTCTATSFDDTPPTVSKTFNITVLDTDLALAGVPANIVVNATGSSGAVVGYAAPTAVDEAGDSPAATVSCAPVSGATFPVGITTVTCMANSADDTPSTLSAKFTVSVLVDLRLNLVVTPSTATTGTVVTGTVRLTNAGAVTRTVTLRLKVTFVSATGQNFTISPSTMTITLSAGQTVTRSLMFTVSSIMPRGSYSVTATASDVTGSINATASLKVT